MMTLKEQLINRTLVANIPNGEFELATKSTYLVDYSPITIVNKEASFIGDLVTGSVLDGDILELDKYVVMDPYIRAIWDTLYENLLLSTLYSNQSSVKPTGDEETIEILLTPVDMEDLFKTLTSEQSVVSLKDMEGNDMDLGTAPTSDTPPVDETVDEVLTEIVQEAIKKIDDTLSTVGSTDEDINIIIDDAVNKAFNNGLYNKIDIFPRRV